MRGTLVSIDAWDRVAQARSTVRVGAARNSSTMGADGFTWEPGLSRRPRLSMQLADDDLTGTVMAATIELAVNARNILRVPNAMQLDWIGSTIRVYSGDGAALGDMRQEFVGRITGGTTNADNGIASITAEADKSLIDVPLLTATYGGGGGIDGDVELRGNIKPAGFGSPVNVKPILINAVANIYQVDAFSNLTSIAGVYEDLASFGAAVADYPSYAALAAATVAEGTWASSIAAGCFRLGAPAKGVITCDPVCGYGLPGSMMLRWLRTHAGVPEARLRPTDFDSLTTQVQAVVGGVPACSFWTAEEGNVLDLMQRMCASCNAVPLLLQDGTVGITRVVGGVEALTLNRQGGSPPVTAWQAQDAPIPWWRMRMVAAKSYYVNSPGEIDYLDDIRDMGDWVSGRVYALGNIVRSPTSGARYIFTAAASAATVDPGTVAPGSTPFEFYQAGPDATQIRYTSGATLNSKEPAEAGANVTETRTANAIQSQGALATQDSAYASQVLFGTSDNEVGDPEFRDTGYWSYSGASVLTAGAALVAMGLRRAVQGVAGNGTTNQASVNSVTPTAAGRFPVLPGQVYVPSFVAYYPPNFAGRVTMTIVWRDRGAAAVGSTVSVAGTDYRTTPNGASAVVQVAAGTPVTSPAGAATGEVRFQQTWPTAIASAGQPVFGRPTLQRGSALGSTLLVRQDGTTALTDATVVTSLGTADTIKNQGGLATSDTVNKNQLSYGAIGRVSLYQHQTPFIVGAGGVGGNGAWQSFMGVGITPQDGNPAVGPFYFVMKNTAGTAANVFIRVIRVSDGTVVFGGSTGAEVPPNGSFANLIIDSTGAGTRQQYDVQMKVNGTTQGVTISHRSEMPGEIGRATIEEIQLKTGDATSGPGAGTAGGGNVNGSTATTTPTDPNSTANPNPQNKSGLYRYAIP